MQSLAHQFVVECLDGWFMRHRRIGIGAARRRLAGVLAALAVYTIDNIPAVKYAPSNAMVFNVLPQQWSFSYVYGAIPAISVKPSR